jgi:ribosome-associated translation inhibitor RaiA
MQILVETDNHLKAGDLQAYVEAAVGGAVEHYAERLTHVEAHVGDVNSKEKNGADDIRCMLEARVTGVKTIAVHHNAESIELAVDGAAAKLAHALSTAVGKLEDRQRRAPGTGHLSADIEAQRPVAADDQA